MLNHRPIKFVPKNPQPRRTARKAVRIQNEDLFRPQDAEARGNLYDFFASVYLRPLKQDLVRFIIARDFLQQLSILFGEDRITDLKQFAAAANLHKDMASLKQDYMDLFAVPTGRYVTPFEDVYLGTMPAGKQPRGPLLGQLAIAVQKMYHQAGAQMDQACKELPTHIGVELSFMNFLCKKEAAAFSAAEKGGLQIQGQTKVADPTAYRKLQVKFLQEHLNAWFPQLSLEIQSKAKTQFYRGLALITEAFLAVDAADLLAQSD